MDHLCFQPYGRASLCFQPTLLEPSSRPGSCYSGWQESDGLQAALPGLHIGGRPPFFLKIVIIMRTMVPNIFRKLRVGLTGLDIKLRKLIQSVPIYHFSVYNTWIKVRYDLVRQLLPSFAGLVDSVVTVLQLYLRLTVDFVAPEYTKLVPSCL